MKVLQVVILAVAMILGANSLPKASSVNNLVELAKRMPRHQLEAELRALLSPAVRAALDDSIINLLDTTVRQIILEGSEDLGIPVLDPLRLEHLDIDINIEGVQLGGTADGVEVRKISTFVVDKIKANLLLLNVEFGVHVPEIVATGEHYAIQGNLGGILPVYGEGAFSASVEDLSITGKITLGSNNSFIYLKALDLDINLSAVKTHFENLLGGGDLSDLANQIVSDLAPGLFENAKPTLIPTLTELILTLANEKLDGITLQDILDLINGSGRSKQ